MQSKQALYLTAVAAGVIMFPYVAMANGFNYDFDNGLHADARLTLSYGLQMRMKGRVAALSTPLIDGAVNGNASDGDANFGKDDITSNSVQALLQSSLRKGMSGLVFSATDFYDDAYHRAPHNPTPLRSTPGSINRFPKYTRYFDGSYPRVLDAYGYTSIPFDNGKLLTLKLGNQVVNWGVMNFFPDMALAQGPVDAVKANMPGAQTQTILLPERQLSVSLQASDKLTLVGDYQFGFHRTLLPGVGSYFSTANISGPGAACLGVYTDGGCTVAMIPGAGAGGAMLDVPGATYAGRNHVNQYFGQFGVGAQYQATAGTRVGVYYLHFNDRTPLPDLQLGPDGIGGTFKEVNLTNEDLVGLTTSSLIDTPHWMGSITASTETTYRWKGTVLEGENGNPGYGHYLTSGLSIFDNLGNDLLSPQTILLFEASGQYVGGVPSSQLTYQTRTAGAFHVELDLDYPGIFPGWELTVPIDYQYQFNGRSLFGPSDGGGDGAYAGVYSIGANMQWHQNLSFGLSYEGFTGGVDVRSVSDHALADRDFMAFTATYTF